MIVDYWPGWFRSLVFQHGAWPRSYCAVDVETTGYSFSQDVVTEWGHCLVEEGEVVDRLSLVINWTGRMTPPDWWLSERLRQVRQGMELAGKQCHMSTERMQAEGTSPDKAFEFIAKFTETIRDKKIPFVFHNGFFDEKMLSANFLQFKFGNGFSFGDVFIDTEGVEKASQLLDNPRAHPRRNDTLRDYFTRVKHTRVNGVKSNLDEHCYAKYRFREKHGIEKKEMHGARMDSYCCHLLMSEFAAMITTPKAPPVYPSADDREARKPHREVTPPRPTVDTNSKRFRGQRRS